MTRLAFGVIAGVLFGALSVGLMLPMSFPDKPRALTAAFASRFAIGLLASTAQLPMPPWARGLLVGLLISLPDALVTRAYAPILIIGSIGGLLVGIASAKWSV
jgi:hypothetical protein